MGSMLVKLLSMCVTKTILCYQDIGMVSDHKYNLDGNELKLLLSCAESEKGISVGLEENCVRSNI